MSPSQSSLAFNTHNSPCQDEFIPKLSKLDCDGKEINRNNIKVVLLPLSKMVETRYKKKSSQLELDCQKLNLLVKNRYKNRKKTVKKIDDILLSIIYLIFYTLAFILFILLCIGTVKYIDNEPPEYLPLDVSSNHLLIDAVQRSRQKKNRKSQKKNFPEIKKFIKKTKYSGQGSILFTNEEDLAAHLITKSSHLKIIKSQLENCSINCEISGNHQMRQRYYECKCSQNCPLNFKVNICLRDQHIELFQEKEKTVDCLSKDSKLVSYVKPTRYANTNSNIESFNRQIKGFTHKKKLTVFGMIDKCEEMVNYYSTLQGDRFNEFPKFNKKVNEIALKLDKSLFKKISMNNYRYKSWNINKNEKCCSCRGFLKHAICQHSLGFSHLKNLQWFGPKYTNRSDEFVFKNKIGRKKGGRYKNALPALESDED